MNGVTLNNIYFLKNPQRGLFIRWGGDESGETLSPIDYLDGSNPSTPMRPSGGHRSSLLGACLL